MTLNGLNTILSIITPILVFLALVLAIPFIRLKRKLDRYLEQQAELEKQFYADMFRQDMSDKFWRTKANKELVEYLRKLQDQA